MIGISRGDPDVGHDFLPGNVVSDSFQDSGGICGFPDREALLRICRVYRFSSEGPAVQEQLGFGTVCHYGNIDQLSRIPVPGDPDMQNGIASPQAPEQKIGILGKTGGICLSEITGAGMVRGGLPDIVNSAPDKLPHTVRAVEIINDHMPEIRSPPACIAVSECGALQVGLAHDRLFNRKVINAAA